MLNGTEQSTPFEVLPPLPRMRPVATPSLAARPAARVAARPAPAQETGLWQRLLDRFAAWRRMAAQRRQLARLDDRMLKDIGLTRVDAHQEARKWFWER